jgi:hypothetical protein
MQLVMPLRKRKQLNYKQFVLISHKFGINHNLKKGQHGEINAVLFLCAES